MVIMLVIEFGLSCIIFLFDWFLYVIRLFCVINLKFNVFIVFNIVFFFNVVMFMMIVFVDVVFLLFCVCIWNFNVCVVNELGVVNFGVVVLVNLRIIVFVLLLICF